MKKNEEEERWSTNTEHYPTSLKTMLVVFFGSSPVAAWMYVPVEMLLLEGCFSIRSFNNETNIRFEYLESVLLSR